MNERENRESQILGGKVAVVTGGAGGIGLAIVNEYLREGAKVAVLDSKNKPADFPVSDSLMYVQCDIRDEKKIGESLDVIEKTLGIVTIIVNNAAIDPKKNFVDTVTNEGWQEVMGVNLEGSRNVTVAFGRRMIEHNIGGSIIFISSVQTAAPIEGDNPYVTSKHALEGYMKSVAVEWGKYGIRANCLAPGWIVNTGMSPTSEEEMAFWGKRLPLRRLGNPQDIANMSVALASDYASYITGQIVRVDGGASIQSPLVDFDARN